LFVPLVLMLMIDGRRGVRQTRPAAVVCGVAFAIAQFACANYLSTQLTDIVASLVSTGAVIGLLGVWQPSEPLAPEGRGLGQPATRFTRQRTPSVTIGV
jgi:lactate permease